MKITAIQQQVKQKGRYSVFTDGVYSFSLGEGALLEQRLAVGQELDKAELRRFKKLSVSDKAYHNALKYAVSRPHSKWEVEEYLRRKQLDAGEIEQILKRLLDLSLINDEAFARSWVESRRLLKPTSRRRLNQELKQKRVDESIIDTVLADDETDELGVLRSLIAKKQAQTKYRTDPLKLMQYLARQGFGYSDIKAALAEPED